MLHFLLVVVSITSAELSECDRIGGSNQDGWILDQLVNSGLGWEGDKEQREDCLERMWSEHGEESQVGRALWWAAEQDAAIRKVLLASIIRDELELDHGLDRVKRLAKLLGNLRSVDKAVKEAELAAAIKDGAAIIEVVPERYRSLPRCPAKAFSYCISSLNVLLDDDASERISIYSNFPKWLNRESGIWASGTMNLLWLVEKDAGARCMLESADDAHQKDKEALHMSPKIIALSATPPSCKHISEDSAKEVQALIPPALVP